MERERFVRMRRMILVRALLLPAAIVMLASATMLYFFLDRLHHPGLENLAGTPDLTLVRAAAVAGALIALGGAAAAGVAWLLASGVASRLLRAEAEKRRLGNQLLMAARLAEVGEMSAGVAHEINNPLQIISAEQTLLGDLLGEEDGDGRLVPERRAQMRDSLREVAVQVDRCKEITRGLLSFARRYEPELRTVRLREFFDEVTVVTAGRSGGRIRVVTELDPAAPELVTDPGQLQQVMVNLLNNAVYALQDRPDPEVRISSRLAGGSLSITVADNGAGIRPEHLEKIFLPFFTTKPVGQGTGLGLSTVYGIVERLGGKVTVASEPDRGSVFTVELPVHRDAT